MKYLDLFLIHCPNSNNIKCWNIIEKLKKQGIFKNIGVSNFDIKDLEEIKNFSSEPIFTRSEVAQILNVTTLTVSNREKNKNYPSPRRDLNNYRVYTLNDVFNLQLLTYSHIDPKPIISILYDKGYSDIKALGQMIDSALSKRTG